MDLQSISGPVAKMPRSHVLELAQHIEEADNFVKANACNKLTTIANQMRYLREQACQVLEDAKRDNELHHVACSFKKVANKMYYLYQKPDGSKYFSMLSPQEWGANGPPHEYQGGYRLEADQSWTPEDQVPQKDAQILSLMGVVNNSQMKPNLLLQNFPAFQ